jgi:hypothetical protein
VFGPLFFAFAAISIAFTYLIGEIFSLGRAVSDSCKSYSLRYFSNKTKSVIEGLPFFATPRSGIFIKSYDFRWM